MASSTAEPSTSLPFKRQLFNKPAWSKPQVSPSTADFFNRSNQTYVNVAAHEELRRKKRLAKKELENLAQGGSEEREEKRRRISDEGEDEGKDEGDHDSSEDERNSMKNGSGRTCPVEARLLSPLESTRPVNPTASSSSLSKSYADTVAAATTLKGRQQPLRSIIIDLEGEDDSDHADEGGVDIEVTAVKPAEPMVYDNIEFSDEEFPELARQAREKARRKRLQADFPTKVMLDPPLGSKLSELGYRSQSVYASSSPPPPSDPVVSIFITSRIPNTNPLIVNRRIGQRLKEVRVTWCQKQQFSPEFSDTVILTWRGKRLFNITSCKSLGIGVDQDGNIVTNGEKDILGEENRKIHMEAMTEIMFDEQKKAKARESREVPDEYSTEQAVVEQPIQETQVKIILKTKGFDEFKLIVKPSTLISRIINAFRMAHKITPDKEVHIHFDGDRLEPPMKVGDTELSDMDYLDVYIK